MNRNKFSVEDIVEGKLQTFSSAHAILTPISLVDQLPWQAVRMFFISSQDSEVRGKHAHRTCSQFFICSLGTVTLRCTDGISDKIYVLDKNEQTLLVPPGIWVTLEIEEKSSLTVLTDYAYDERDYIRDWDEYLHTRDLK
jgi:hypothetical protein